MSDPTFQFSLVSLEQFCASRKRHACNLKGRKGEGCDLSCMVLCADHGQENPVGTASHSRNPIIFCDALSKLHVAVRAAIS